MTQQDLERRVAELEFVNDQLTAELSYVDQLMRQVGFVDGLASVKASAQEVLEQGVIEESDDVAA